MAWYRELFETILIGSVTVGIILAVFLLCYAIYLMVQEMREL